MATLASIETRSGWREERDLLITQHRLNDLPVGVQIGGGKHMDRNPLVPLDQMPADEVDFLAGLWTAYDKMISAGPRRYIQERVNTEVIGFVLTRRERPVTIASFGAGNGRVDGELMGLLRKRWISADFTLVDQSAVALDLARQRFQRAGFDSYPHLSFVTSDTLVADRPQSFVRLLHEDAGQTSISTGSQTVAASVNVFHHLTSGEVIGVANAMHGSLKDGGKFVIVDTHPLPEGLRRPAIEFIIRTATNPKRVAASIERQTRQPLGEQFRKGVNAFCLHDTPQAFVQALTLRQLCELLGDSNLSNQIARAELLKSTFLKGLARPVNPDLNIVTGIKS